MLHRAESSDAKDPQSPQPNKGNQKEKATTRKQPHRRVTIRQKKTNRRRPLSRHAARPATTAATHAAAATHGPAVGNPWVTISKPPRPVRIGVKKAPPQAPFLRHKVGVTCCAQSYQIQTHEVTWSEYETWASGHPERKVRPPYFLPKTAQKRARYPVVGIAWEQAAAYCRSLGGRLPTEAQWEYAARGPQMDPNPWGADAADPRRVALLEGVTARLRRVCQSPDDRRSYPDGTLCDLGGNALEWTRDPYRYMFGRRAPRAFRWRGREAEKWRAVRGLPVLGPKKPSWLLKSAALYRLPGCKKQATCKNPLRRKNFNFTGFRCVRPLEAR